MWPWTAKQSLSVSFFEIEMYTSTETWINKLSIEYGLSGSDNILRETTSWKIWNMRVQKKKSKYWENRPLKVVQIKFLAMHITNQKRGFDIFTVRHLQNIFMEHDLYLIS